MDTQLIDRSFLGTGWNFPPTFRREWYGVEMVSDKANVEKSIKIILSTRPTSAKTELVNGNPVTTLISGERIMLPTFGCDLQAYFFEPMNVPNIAMIEKIVKDALTYHEPRIIVEELISTPYPLQGLLEINISYTLIVTNTRYNYVFPFYMKEATNIETSLLTQ